jgi:hypothetical protein
VDVTSLHAEAERLSQLLDNGIGVLKAASEEFALAEHDYRKAKAVAYLRHTGTVAEREASSEAEVGPLRLARDLASGKVETAREAVRSRRSQVGLVSALLASHRAEAEFARVQPRS